MSAELVSKREVEKLLENFSDKVDIEEFMYRLYLLKKINEGKNDIEEGRFISHEDALNRISKKWQS